MNNVVDRAKNIVLTPKTEWTAIAVEPTSVQDIYTTYLIPLALVPAIATFIGSTIIGLGVPAAFMQGILQFGLALAVIYVVGLIINVLAPTFGGQKDQLSAFKVAAYSATPMLLAGIFALVPTSSLALFASLLLSLYGIYVLYLGLPGLMRAPQDRAVAYTAVVVLSALVLFLVLGFMLAAILT
jgi:hypothetical protein